MSEVYAPWRAAASPQPVALRLRSIGVALIMVLLVLSTLAVVGVPFVLSMVLQDREAHYFSDRIKARFAAEAARNHAMARLQDTVYAVEWEREAEEIDEGRRGLRLNAAPVSVRRGGRRSKQRASLNSRRSRVIRKDLGEKTRRTREALRRSKDSKDKKRSDDNRTLLPDYLEESEFGPSPRERDDFGEVAVKLTPVSAPESNFVAGGSGGDQASADRPILTLRDRGSVFATATATDEQGKINVNTAPPNVIASLLGVTELAGPLAPVDDSVRLVDGSVFRGDSDSATLDGAVIVQHPSIGTEAITYRQRNGNTLTNCLRGAFFSLPFRGKKTFPRGSLVYDLRGWKIGYHRLWAGRQGGFEPVKLTRFHSIESLRDISKWQIVSLFLGRFSGRELTTAFLEEQGIRPKEVIDFGLDHYLISNLLEDVRHGNDAVKKRYRIAERRLQRLRFPRDVLRTYRKLRGEMAVVELAARLDGGSRRDVEKVVKEIMGMVRGRQGRTPRFSAKYLRSVLRNLAEVYKTPGVETLLPEDVERLRRYVTVHSAVAAEWSEGQVLLGDLVPGKRNQLRVPRPGVFAVGTIARIRAHDNPDLVEFNEVGRSGRGGVQLRYPTLNGVKQYGGVIDALERHPVNINTAPRAVLRAVFVGLRQFQGSRSEEGNSDDEWISLYVADQLAAQVIEKRPFSGPEEFAGFLEEKVEEGTLEDWAVATILANSIQPGYSELRVSTVGFTYATGDVYTIESRAVSRTPGGRRVAQVQFRDVVDVSRPGRRRVGLMTQKDLIDGTYFRTPNLTGLFPEQHHLQLIEFPGTRSHLMQTRPLLVHRGRWIFPGGDPSTLRLMADRDTTALYTAGSIHFDDTYEGTELAPGEIYSVSFTDGDGASLMSRPAGIEFWFRLLSYPQTRTDDGHLLILHSGQGGERDWLSLLYDQRRGAFLFRVRGPTLLDPSLPKGEDGEQYLEIVAPHTLELETWYHIRALWDGVYGGGCQLFIDGLPAGTDNLSTELINAIPAPSESSPGARAVVVKDASRFPSEGVVRVGAELFEYTRSGNSLRIRQEPSSSWRPSLGGNRSTPQRPSSRPQSNRALTMRGPWNRRGSVAGSHPVGARVTLHGYALEVRRKIVEPNESERQAVGGEVVWTEGGRELVEPLPAVQFADGVYLEHVEIVDLSPGTAGAAEYLVPMANVGEYEIELEPGLEEEFDTTSYQWSATVSVGGEPVPASDYFQSRGVCVAYSSAFMLYYVKEPVPTEVLQRFAHASAQRFDLSGLSEPLMGLRVVGAYEEGTRGPIPATDFLEFKRAERERLRGKIRRLNGLGFDTGSITVHTQIGPNSLLADAQVERRYPRLGVLEMRGSPPRWDTTRSNYAGQTPFGKHPDDVVEWLRYRDALDTTVGGQRVHLFVGRRQNVSRSTFRGYPSGDRQLDHLPGEPLRLVMELSEAGAGYGDYVSITSNNPDKFEPEVYRVYKVMERRDGRFFVSLFDSSLGGSRFQHRYTRSENPRLVKFPSARPPQWGSARASIFGTDSGVQLSTSGGEELIEEVGSVRRPGVEDPVGSVLDEIKKYQNTSIPTSTDFGTRVRFALVPLDNGRVRTTVTGKLRSLTGSIPVSRKITPSNPLDVFVVSVSTESGQPTLFAAGQKEGVLRIGAELFYFEDPKGDSGGGDPGTGAAQGARRRPSAARSDQSIETTESGTRSGFDRYQSTVLPADVSGFFEPQGFARIDGTRDGVSQFYEVFYYNRLGFRGVLSAQLGTPYLGRPPAGARIHNVTRRVRLIGRSLLETKAQTHVLGDEVAAVPYLQVVPVTGPITDMGLPVRDATSFVRPGYVLIDSMTPGTSKEIIAHLGAGGEGHLRLARDEKGRAILRGRFGTPIRPVGNGVFAYAMPFRYFDRYQAEADSESLAYLQKSFRIPGARWRGLSWRLKVGRQLRDRRVDVVVLVRFDGAPNWGDKPTNRPGGLYFFEDQRQTRSKEAQFELDQWADQMEVRVFFRYQPGAFTRVGEGIYTDDWKESPILEALYVEYEKEGRILRHEELAF